jgi:hypothetical protein
MPICSSIFPTTSYNCFRVSGLILRSFIHFLSWCWYRVRKQGSQSSTCEYTVFSVIFVEEAVFSPPYVLVSFVKKCHCTFSVCTSLSGSSRGTVWYICAVGRCRFGDCAHSAPEYGPPTGSWACWSRTGWRKWSCIVPGPCAPWPCLLLSGPDEKPAQTPHLSNLCVRIHIQSSTSSLSPPSLLSLANSAAPRALYEQCLFPAWPPYVRCHLYQSWRLLESLSIAQCQLAESDLKHLFQCLSIHQLKHLDLREVWLRYVCPEPLQILLESVADTPKTLDLEDCVIRDP